MTFGKFWMVSMRFMPVDRPLMMDEPTRWARPPSMLPMAVPPMMEPKPVENLFPASVPPLPMALFTAPVNLDMSGMMVM